jgi:hypothetical protein
MMGPIREEKDRVFTRVAVQPDLMADLNSFKRGE